MTLQARAVVGSILFFLAAPSVVAGVMPWWMGQWEGQSPLPLRIVGVLLIVGGVAVLLDSFARFAIQGIGTPAPVAPTRHLVVTGLYRYVRNPIYLGLVSAILGQGLFFADARLLVYGAVVWLAVHLFVLVYEEPTLRKTFGTQYAVFCRNVPRWIPRRRPWRDTTGQGRA